MAASIPVPSTSREDEDRSLANPRIFAIAHDKIAAGFYPGVLELNLRQEVSRSRCD
jgi:hypothetical protein